MRAMTPQIIENDPTKLAAYIAGIGRGLIAFDGRPIAGKTHLARDMAQRVGCTAVDVDKFLVPAADNPKQMFVGALRIADLRRRIEESGPLVLLSGLCARQVVEALGLTAAAFVWVERASLLRLGQIRRDFFEFDDGADATSEHPVYEEVEAYIAACDARRRPDVIYLNAYD